jgi:hypothetical protein
MARAPEESSPTREPIARVLPHHARAEDGLLNLALRQGLTEKAHKREAGTQITTARSSRSTYMTCINTSASVYELMETSAAPRDSMRRMSAEMSRDEMTYEPRPADVQSMNAFTMVREHHSSRLMQTNDQGGFMQGYSASSRKMYDQHREQPSVSMLEESLAASYQMPMPSQAYVLSEDSVSVALSDSVLDNELPRHDEADTDTESQGWFFKWGR